MKKLSIVLSFVLGLASLAQASIVLNMNGAVLYNSDGTPLPQGTLLQLIVSRTPNTGFDAPAPGSFTGGSADDVVLASFSINNAQNVSGSFGEQITFNLGNGVDTGDQILLRWFPGLTLASPPPGAGQVYGEFRTDAVQDQSDIAWVIPSDGASVFLNFFTESQGGANPEMAGFAQFTVVPEPSTYALLAVGLGAVAIVRRRRKSAAR